MIRQYGEESAYVFDRRYLAGRESVNWDLVVDRNDAQLALGDPVSEGYSGRRHQRARGGQQSNRQLSEQPIASATEIPHGPPTEPQAHPNEDTNSMLFFAEVLSFIET